MNIECTEDLIYFIENNELTVAEISLLVQLTIKSIVFFDDDTNPHEVKKEVLCALRQINEGEEKPLFIGLDMG